MATFISFLGFFFFFFNNNNNNKWFEKSVLGYLKVKIVFVKYFIFELFANIFVLK